MCWCTVVVAASLLGGAASVQVEHYPAKYYQYGYQVEDYFTGNKTGTEH